MATLITCYGLLFGEVDDSKIPQLPEGFTIKKEKNEWLMATAPDGTRYFVQADKLTKESFNERGRFYDDSVQIFLPTPIQ